MLELFGGPKEAIYADNPSQYGEGNTVAVNGRLMEVSTTPPHSMTISVAHTQVDDDRHGHLQMKTSGIGGRTTGTSGQREYATKASLLVNALAGIVEVKDMIALETKINADIMAVRPAHSLSCV